MTSIQILEHLAKDFSSTPDHVRQTLEMIDAGLCAPFIARVRRAETGGLQEMVVRRLDRARKELEELDRRRGTILRMLEGCESATPQDLERVQACMDRFDLEDLFVPHRRPEPEVQLALDRGLGKLAAVLVEPLPREEREAEAAADSPGESVDEDESAEAGDAPAPSDSSDPSAPSAPSALGTAEDAAAAPDAAPEEAGDAGDAGPAAETESVTEEGASPAEGQAATPPADAAPAAPVAADPVAAHVAGGAAAETAKPASDAGTARKGTGGAAEATVMHEKVELTPALARLCAPFVDPDKGIHTDIEALEGAMRILSDGLGRNSRLRGSMRRMLRKHGVLSVRATVDDSKLGRHRSLLKLKQPLRQLQGHRLLAIRQAQKERAVTAVLTLDPKRGLPKVRQVLGKYTHPDCASVLDVVARRAFERRLMPVVEADVRLELKERADDEALRFLAQHLRQVLLTPPLGAQYVVGIDVNAKGDWTLVGLDPRGAVVGPPQAIEVGEKDAETLGAELKAALETIGASNARNLAVGCGKLPRAGLAKLRPALRAAGIEAHAYIVNDAGLSTYANSELARKELSELTVPQRLAAGIGRRLQDPLAEILKVDPRNLGLGSEQGLVSKANVRRMFDEVVESCVALVGCDVNTAQKSMLKHLPGIDGKTADRIVTRRAEKPIESREELRAEGLLTEAQWTGAIACLRVSGSAEPLDATNLHPSQYDLARRIVDATGVGIEEALRRPGATKGLRRVDFTVDEYTWRDLMREISYPGRDARQRLFAPRLVDPAADPATLQPGRSLEGTISNVASFGAFVDLGLPTDGMIHISQISDRYVRDARELLCIGQTVRVRITEGSAQRMALSLKNVPPPERPPRRPRDAGESGGSRERGPGRGGRGGRGGRSPEPAGPPVRAARTRRDGLVAGTGGGRNDRPGRGRGGGGGGGGGWQGGRGGGRGRDRDGDAPFRPEDLGPPKAAFNPFATFFKGSGDDGSAKAEAPKPKAKPKPVDPAVAGEPPKAPDADGAGKEGSASAPAESAAERAPE